MAKHQSTSTDVLIVGAGVAGLSCALELQAAGKQVLVCEGEDRVGGRVATDEVDGFRLDRGFQVLLTAYPEAQRLLDYKALDLRPIYPGALVRYGRKWYRVADPFRHPLDALGTIFNPIGSLTDKLRVGGLRLRGFDLHKYPDSMSTLSALQAEGFSSRMMERFFRPFLSGVFLDAELRTTVRKLEDVLKNFARGDTAVPARGMGQIPAQMAGKLPNDRIRLGTRIVKCDPHGGQVASGEHMEAKAVVIATDVRAAQVLLGHEGRQAPVNGVACLYYEIAEPPPIGATLVLNGEGRGPINNLTLMSAVNPDCAPSGRHLLSVSVVKPEFRDTDDLEERVSQQLKAWFGDPTTVWRHLATYRIKEAVPARPPRPSIPVRMEKGLYSCGDYRGIASLNSAMASGRETALAVLQDMT